jgi:methylmalonyl-CoA mutase C-terminal domain/subunit
MDDVSAGNAGKPQNRHMITGQAHLQVPERRAGQARPIRVLIAKPGLDGHDRGAKVLARALRDAGMEVIYTGIRQSPEMIVQAAVQEDVDVVGLSCHSGAHMALFPRIMQGLREAGLDDVIVLAGGIIPDADVPAIKAMGIREVFGPGTPTARIIEYIRAAVAERASLFQAQDG